jgi:outer membrane protein assembly factor BamB
MNIPTVMFPSPRHAPGRRVAVGACAALLLLASVHGADPAPPVPAAIDGRWAGTMRHGSDTGFAGFEFQRQPDGRVLARAWLPELNLYGTPIGWVAMVDGRPLIREFNVPLALEDGALTGSIYLPDLTFSVRRTSDPLPAESTPPPAGPAPEPAWTYAAGAPLWAGPVVADGIAYLGDAGGHFHAVRVADGRREWAFDAGAPLFGPAAVTPDAVFFAGDNGRLYKLDRKTGAQRWRVDLGGAGVRSVPSPEAPEWDYLTAAPAAVDGTVFVGSADGVLHARSSDTGAARWSFKTGAQIRGAALVAGDRVFAGSMDHFVYALDRRTGAELWRFDTGSPATTAPVLANGRVVIGTRDQALLFALDPATGRRLWADYFWLSWVESTPAFVDGLLYLGSSDSRRVRVIEPGAGRVLWSAPVGGWTWGTPLVVGDTVYYGTAGAPQYFIPQKPSLGALDRRTGALKWRRPLPLLEKSYLAGIPGSLAYAAGRILAASLDGTLTAYDVGPP